MNLFAYGTLIDPEIIRRAAGELPLCRWATLEGYERKAMRGKTYPGLRKKKGASVRGVLYFDLSAGAWDRLDLFEGEMYVREEVAVCLDNGPTAPAWVYVTAPAFLGELSSEGWEYEEFRRRGKDDFEELYEGFDR
jgi:gamma-glutamylcyclotransferase (GGCT)/AIG2-like uncharacterized protein YtfP